MFVLLGTLHGAALEIFASLQIRPQPIARSMSHSENSKT
jgi:hypothetical protein